MFVYKTMASFIILLIMHRSTRSTLFPYTTLFRSRPERVTGHTGTEIRPRLLREAAVGNFAQWRSEEHTSELQSRFDLVCRLLLEKKNIEKNDEEDKRRKDETQVKGGVEKSTDTAQ